MSTMIVAGLKAQNFPEPEKFNQSVSRAQRGAILAERSEASRNLSFLNICECQYAHF